MDRSADQNRRARVLTPDDITAIGETFDQRLIRWFESIGYDVSTPDARAGIREDHTWIRDFRIGTGKVKTGGMVALVTSAISGFVWLVFHVR